MGISAIRQVLTEVAWTTLVSLLFSLVSFGLLIVYDAHLAVLTATLVTALFAVTILTSLRQLRSNGASTITRADCRPGTSDGIGDLSAPGRGSRIASPGAVGRGVQQAASARDPLPQAG